MRGKKEREERDEFQRESHGPGFKNGNINDKVMEAGDLRVQVNVAEQRR